LLVQKRLENNLFLIICRGNKNIARKSGMSIALQVFGSTETSR